MRVGAKRMGSVLPMVVISLVALLGFVALAIDVGMLLVSKTECQHAADCAATAGARTLNGDVSANNNYAAAGPKVMEAAPACSVLTKPVVAASVKYEIGYYTYDRNARKFGVFLPSSGQTMSSNDNWSLVRAQVSATNPSAFAKVFGAMSLSTTAVATAVHRPRDICIIMDFSGSMSFDSLLGGTYYGTRSQSLNPDDIYPRFGHYAGFNPDLVSPVVRSDGEVLGLSNTAVDTAAGTAIVNDFYQNALGGTPVAAFTAALDTFQTAPDGDPPLRQNNNSTSGSYATCLSNSAGTGVLSPVTTFSPSWEPKSDNSNANNCGYSSSTLNTGSAKQFKGYTTGPRYWGKTFFIWPPDPRGPSSNLAGDWRKRFFFKADGTTPLDDNSALWTTGTSPIAKAPRSSSGTNFVINYAAILRWLKTTGPNPFPNQLRAGRICYYSAIPDVSNTANDAALNTRFTAYPVADLDERFWKDYIDYVLGFQQTAAGPIYAVITPNTGYGDDFSWGTPSITAKPTGTTNVPYMTYTDNPPRPKTRFWFGPMTMVDFIDNYNQMRRWMPGTAHQAPLWGCKIGMKAAILDIQKNHPNDYVCLSFFNTPEFSAGDGGQFNRIRTPLGRSYQHMVDSLFYPPITIDDPGNHPEIRPYDAQYMNDVPHADGATCPAMGLMQAYNQFSSNSSLVSFNPSPAPPGDAGGLGRIGAQKMIIFMTDGVANQPANAGFSNQGPYQSYYNIRIPGEYPTMSVGNSSSVPNQVYAIANQICALDTANPAGYSTLRKPVIIHCVAFGSLFDPSVATTASQARSDAFTILQQLQFIGKTQSDPSTPLPNYKIITGPSAQRVTLIQQAFQRIMQFPVTVSLVE